MELSAGENLSPFSTIVLPDDSILDRIEEKIQISTMKQKLKGTVEWQHFLNYVTFTDRKLFNGKSGMYVSKGGLRLQIDFEEGAVVEIDTFTSIVIKESGYVEVDEGEALVIGIGGILISGDLRQELEAALKGDLARQRNKADREQREAHARQIEEYIAPSKQVRETKKRTPEAKEAKKWSVSMITASGPEPSQEEINLANDWWNSMTFFLRAEDPYKDKDLPAGTQVEGRSVAGEFQIAKDWLIKNFYPTYYKLPKGGKEAVRARYYMWSDGRVHRPSPGYVYYSPRQEPVHYSDSKGFTRTIVLPVVSSKFDKEQMQRAQEWWDSMDVLVLKENIERDADLPDGTIVDDSEEDFENIREFLLRNGKFLDKYDNEKTSEEERKYIVYLLWMSRNSPSPGNVGRVGLVHYAFAYYEKVVLPSGEEAFEKIGTWW